MSSEIKSDSHTQEQLVTETVSIETENPNTKPISTTVVSNTSGTSSRRVKRTFNRIIRDASSIADIEAGDTLVRQFKTGVDVTAIEDIGSDISSASGIHVRTSDGNAIHLRLLMNWVEKDLAYIHGKRTEKFTQVEDVDY